MWRNEILDLNKRFSYWTCHVPRLHSLGYIPFHTLLSLAPSWKLQKSPDKTMVDNGIKCRIITKLTPWVWYVWVLSWVVVPGWNGSTRLPGISPLYSQSFTVIGGWSWRWYLVLVCSRHRRSFRNTIWGISEIIWLKSF